MNRNKTEAGWIEIKRSRMDRNDQKEAEWIEIKNKKKRD
jgi:hypothetical protein